MSKVEPQSDFATENHQSETARDPSALVATDRAAIRWARADVVTRHRFDVAAFVRRVAPAGADLTEGTQVGCLGLLVAFEHAPDVPFVGGFWSFARSYVANEVERWLMATVGAR